MSFISVKLIIKYVLFFLEKHVWPDNNCSVWKSLEVNNLLRYFSQHSPSEVDILVTWPVSLVYKRGDFLAKEKDEKRRNRKCQKNPIKGIPEMSQKFACLQVTRAGSRSYHGERIFIVISLSDHLEVHHPPFSNETPVTYFSNTKSNCSGNDNIPTDSF